MKIGSITRLFGFWKTFKADITFLHRALMHKKTSWLVKGLIGLLVIYIISPLDLIPGWIIGLGVIDDIGLAMIVAGWVKQLIPERLREELEGKIIANKE